MLVCNKCWKTRNECNCYNAWFVEIDDNIFPTIKKLNSLGYKTRFCCEGHTDRGFLSGYIYFANSKDDEVFDELPDGWEYENFKYRGIKKYKYNIINGIIGLTKRQIDKLTREEKQELIDKNLKSLSDWVNTLQPVTEDKKELFKHLY